MPFCVHCGEQISYLPFNCKYCGGTFCKKDRLPENHDCSFELKHTSVVPVSSRGTQEMYKDTSPERSSYDHRMEKERRKILKEQERQRKQALRGYKSLLSGGGAGGGGGGGSATPGTIAIIILIAIFSIVSFIFAMVGIPHLIALSVYGLLNLYLWVIITSIFISYSTNIFGFFFLFILLIFLYNIARNIEIQFGTRFLISLYLICAAFTALFYFIIRFLLAPLYPIGLIALPVGLAIGAVLGLICYMIYFNPNKEMMMFCFFIPVKMKGKTLLLMLILFRLIPGLLFSLFFGPYYLVWYLPDLGGILASYIVFRVKIKRR